jgi:hypothetical protein
LTRIKNGGAVTGVDTDALIWTTRPHWAMSSSLCDRSAEE